MNQHDIQAAGVKPAVDSQPSRAWRASLRNQVLAKALRKRTSGIPTYSVPEAAALLSISPEYLYRLIRAGEFPAVRLGFNGGQSRFVVPAGAVEKLLESAEASAAEGGAR